MRDLDEQKTTIIEVASEINYLISLISEDRSDTNFTFILYLLSMVKEEAYIMLHSKTIELQH
ncbi:hypothetical protein DXT89_08630 [Agrobacterium vitis]|uniref:Uncharacterized protein n=1 Tax=Agrobacterium vitis TaxID=373 RepID=A0A368NSV7_AGRVI|nr:hypothetical protein DXM22_11105 [Agrobacterium vitis]KAA3529757.1 hypothetical protein DXT89_08630 [Agrobacterium vitis]RCU52311.1 hypothetical protein ASB66_019465 [Agrobacterium vitis]